MTREQMIVEARNSAAFRHAEANKMMDWLDRQVMRERIERELLEELEELEAA